MNLDNVKATVAKDEAAAKSFFAAHKYVIIGVAVAIAAVVVYWVAH